MGNAKIHIDKTSSNHLWDKLYKYYRHTHWGVMNEWIANSSSPTQLESNQSEQKMIIKRTISLKFFCNHECCRVPSQFGLVLKQWKINFNKFPNISNISQKVFVSIKKFATFIPITGGRFELPHHALNLSTLMRALRDIHFNWFQENFS